MNRKEATKFRIWLEFEEWETDQKYDPFNDFFNMTIEFDNGKKYHLNVWTIQYLKTAFEEQLSERGSIGGKYLVMPDLIVEKMERELLLDIVNDMITNNELSEEWLYKPVPDEK